VEVGPTVELGVGVIVGVLVTANTLTDKKASANGAGVIPVLVALNVRINVCPVGALLGTVTTKTAARVSPSMSVIEGGDTVTFQPAGTLRTERLKVAVAPVSLSSVNLVKTNWPPGVVSTESATGVQKKFDACKSGECMLAAEA
jgi:hypothetical protein